MIPHILPALMAGPQGGGASPWGTLIMFAAIFAIFYFLLIRPQRKQQKEHEEMVENLQKGDEVVTVGGIIGKIIHLEDDRLVVKTSDDTRIEVERGKVGRKISRE
ncbi:MAG TPA: preprotein translocase subunit YajC [Gemmatimonadota bacterium]|nr:preprotein translocase subunit YajC [Gemmatimonadota bacterium]